MKRKVIRIANSTSVVSLPKEWLSEYNINKGDELNLERLKNSIVIRTNNLKSDEVSIDITNLHFDLIWRYLITAYRKGTERIMIKYSPEFLETLQSYIKDLVGMAVIKQKDNTLILKDFFYNNSETNLDDLLKRVFNLVKDMSKDVLTAIQEKDANSLKDMRHRDFNINKFTNLCLRILNKGVYKEYNDSLLLYKFISVLEDMGDEYRKIGELCSENNHEVNKNVLEVFGEVNELLEDYYGLFYDYDKKKLIDFHERYYHIMSKLKKNYNNRKNSEIQILSSLNTVLNSLKNVCEDTLVVNI